MTRGGRLKGRSPVRAVNTAPPRGIGHHQRESPHRRSTTMAASCGHRGGRKLAPNRSKNSGQDPPVLKKKIDRHLRRTTQKKTWFNVNRFSQPRKKWILLNVFTATFELDQERIVFLETKTVSNLKKKTRETLFYWADAETRFAWKRNFKWLRITDSFDKKRQKNSDGKKNTTEKRSWHLFRIKLNSPKIGSTKAKKLKKSFKFDQKK